MTGVKSMYMYGLNSGYLLSNWLFTENLGQKLLIFFVPQFYHIYNEGIRDLPYMLAMKIK